MAVCSFSGKTIPTGKGIHLFLRDGTSLWFFDRKCESLYMQKRSAAKLKWTAKGKARHQERKKVPGTASPAKPAVVAAKPAAKVEKAAVKPAVKAVVKPAVSPASGPTKA